MSTHMRSEAMRQFQKILIKRIDFLKENGGFDGVVAQVGKSVYNKLCSDMVCAVPQKDARRAITVLDFDCGEKSQAHVLLAVIHSPVGNFRQPRRRQRYRELTLRCCRR